MTLPMVMLAAGLLSAPEPAAAAEPPVQEKVEAAEAGAAQAQIEAGLKAFKRRRFAQAEAAFLQAVEADPASAAAHFYLGYTYYKIAEPKRPFHPDKQKAAEEFAKAFELDKTFRPVWGPRGAAGGPEAAPPKK